MTGIWSFGDWQWPETGYSFVVHYLDGGYDEFHSPVGVRETVGGVWVTTDGEYGATLFPWTRVARVEHKDIARMGVDDRTLEGTKR